MSNIGRIFYFRMIFESFDILSLVCHCTSLVLPMFNHIFVYRMWYSDDFIFMLAWIFLSVLYLVVAWETGYWYRLVSMIYQVGQYHRNIQLTYLQSKLTGIALTSWPVVIKGTYHKCCPCCKTGQMITLLTFGRRGPPAEFYKSAYEKSTSLVSIWCWVGWLNVAQQNRDTKSRFSEETETNWISAMFYVLIPYWHTQCLKLMKNYY